MPPKLHGPGAVLVVWIKAYHRRPNTFMRGWRETGIDDTGLPHTGSPSEQKDLCREYDWAEGEPYAGVDQRAVDRLLARGAGKQGREVAEDRRVRVVSLTSKARVDRAGCFGSTPRIWKHVCRCDAERKCEV